MRRDTLAIGLLLVFLLPFSLSVAMGYMIDYERGCTHNRECPTGASCQQGICRNKVGCAHNFVPPPTRATSREEAYRLYQEKRAIYQAAQRRWYRERSNDARDEYRAKMRAYLAAQSAYYQSLSRYRPRPYYNRNACPDGSVCNRTGGYCYYPTTSYSSWIYFHPGYYPHRAQMARMSAYRGRAGGRYRSGVRGYRSARGFRGGGLGFGK